MGSMDRSWLLLFLILSGCYVNRAVIDPWSYAPSGSCCYWLPDCKGGALACDPSVLCPDLPDPNHVLSLAEVLDIALLQNTQTQITWAQARQAAAQYGQSQSSAFPNISIDYYRTHQRSTFLTSQVEPNATIIQNEVLVSDEIFWGPQANLSYTIFDFGVLRYTSEAARYALYFADYTHNDAIQSVMETITLDYYNALAQKQLLIAKEADLATSLETLAAADLGFAQGARNLSDVLEARTQTLLAEINLFAQHQTLNTANATLLDDMGLPSNTPFQLARLPIVNPASISLDPLDTYIELAYQCRPDLLGARATLASAEMSLKAAKRQWLPQLDYSLQIGKTYWQGGFQDDYNFISTFTVSMPLFTGFYIRNQIKLSQAEVEAAVAELRQMELEVIKDLTTAHYNVGIAFETLKAANRFLEVTQEQYKVAIAQYREGVNTILDVVSAQSSLFNARAQQAEATQQWFSSLATLSYSAGIIAANPTEQYP